MTRFARARGSKAANQKLPGEATKWSDMKKKAEEEEEVEESAGEVEGESEGEGEGGAEWARIEAEEEKSGTENEDDADSDEAPTEVKILKAVEALPKTNPPGKTGGVGKRLAAGGKTGGVGKRLAAGGKTDPRPPPRNESLHKPTADQEGNRPAKRAGGERAQRFCFLCREAGHMMAECPSGKEKSRLGICFKCGSTEHRAAKCKSKGGFKFARCFYCEGEGHIARECPDNPRGVYPQGGACRECGDVTHYKKDCPKLQKAKAEKAVTVKVADKRTAIDALDDDDEPPRPSPSPSPSPRKVVKI